MEVVKKERKSKALNATLTEAQESLRIAEERAKIQEENELAEKDAVKKTIVDICAEHDYFCGVILHPVDLVGILELALRTHEPVKIPFTLYYND